MATQVIMPQLGESVEEGTIIKWLLAEGETIKEFEPLLEVNTDKVDTEIPAPASGTLLKILIPEGETVKAGTLLAWIGEAGESLPDKTKPLAPGTVKETESQAEQLETTITQAPTRLPSQINPQGRDRELGFISPIVARIASENQIDLYQITGTGVGGRITKNDLINYMDRKEQRDTQEKPLSPKIGSTSPAQKEISQGVTPTVKSQPSQGQLIPLNPVRKSIAEHMVMSKHTSPHVTTVMEVDLSRVVAHRAQNKAAFSQDGINLTFTAYFVSATVTALKAYPIVNSSWRDDGIFVHKDIHIGMATSLGEAGLIVPVIKYADQLSLLGLARTINDLAYRARTKQLKPDEVRGGTFSITNHGTSGSLFASPIINQPQCAILGVGAIQKRVIVLEDEMKNDTIAIRPMVYLSLTFDHRILDGAIADYFLAKVVESLANW